MIDWTGGNPFEYEWRLTPECECKYEYDSMPEPGIEKGPGGTAVRYSDSR